MAKYLTGGGKQPKVSKGVKAQYRVHDKMSNTTGLRHATSGTGKINKNTRGKRMVRAAPKAYAIGKSMKKVSKILKKYPVKRSK